MHLVRVARALLTNATMYLAALKLGEPKELSPGEMAERDRSTGNDDAPATLRGWEYEARMAGCEHLARRRTELLSEIRRA